MNEPNTEALLKLTPANFDTDSLTFEGRRGLDAKHLSRAELVDAIEALPPAPTDKGSVELLVGRGPNGERVLHRKALLSVKGGMPEDRWGSEEKYGLDYQLATTRADTSRLIANGQALELHGDNLFLNLDLSSNNLPVGSLVRAGDALLRVTPQEHNGCKKWVQRFGLAAMRLNMDAEFRAMRLRGIYFQVVEDGLVKVGDSVLVQGRG